MAAKRRLPVLQTPQDTDPPRAPWQWVGFGAVAIVVLWVPLAAAASAMTSRIVGPYGPSRPDFDPRAILIFLGLSGLALAISAFAGGFVVGRWGGGTAGVREASLAGLAASFAAVLASWASYGVTASALVVVLLALPFAALGGRAGRAAAPR